MRHYYHYLLPGPTREAKEVVTMPKVEDLEATVGPTTMGEE